MEITRYERHGVLFDSCAAMEKAGFPNGFSTRVGGVSPPPWDSLNLGPPAATSRSVWRRISAASAALWGQTRTLW
ncbi:MAG: hypothetical protein ACLT3D_01715 [Lawsonibacter sp.]